MHRIQPNSSPTLLALCVRYAEQKAIAAFQEGRIGGTLHTCIGQELLPAMLSQHFSDFTWFSNHRGHGHFLAKTLDFQGFFAELLGKEGAAAGGVGGSQHLYGNGFFSNGILGGMAPIASGYAAGPLENGSVLFLGDGALNQGVVYESLNISHTIRSRMLVVVEENRIAQSTDTRSVTAGQIRDRMKAFGFQSFIASDADPSNLEKVVETCRDELLANDRVALIVSTNRLAPHSKGDDTRSEAEVDSLWAEDFLTKWSATEPGASEADIARDFVERTWENVVSRAPIESLMRSDVMGEVHFDITEESLKLDSPRVEFYNDHLRSMLHAHSELHIWGEDIEDFPGSSGKAYGGAFKVTKGLSQDFGTTRVQNMPISEAAIVGSAIGRAMSGRPTIVEVMFSDFLSLIFDQVVNHLSKIQKMYGCHIKIPLVIRAPSGRGRGYGPTHSGNLETHFAGIPGLSLWVLHGRSPYGEILNEALLTGKPSLVVENKALYNHVPAEFTTRHYRLSDRACGCTVAKSEINSNLVIVAVGALMTDSLEVAEKVLLEEEWAFTIVAPSRISPHSCGCVFDLMAKADAVAFVEEGPASAGLGPFLFSNYFSQGIKAPRFVTFIGGADLVPSHRSLESLTTVTPDVIETKLRAMMAQMVRY